MIRASISLSNQLLSEDVADFLRIPANPQLAQARTELAQAHATLADVRAAHSDTQAALQQRTIEAERLA
ncbi:hypothetical protein NLR80_26585, partial [Escherichia coli]|nr:hypothetical protein [Escherichia coli]